MTLVSILAELPEFGGYVSLLKAGIVVVNLALWGLVCQWVDRDTDVVKTKREQWNMIVIGGGVAAMAAWLLLPWPGGLFYLGWALYLVLAVSAIGGYIMHRNGRVISAYRVMTADHFRRLTGKLSGPKKPKFDVSEKVKITDSAGQKVKVPEETEAAEQYMAVQDLLSDALWRRASEVDLVIGQENIRLAYRIDGVAQERKDLMTKQSADLALLRMKSLAGLNTEERRRLQHGKIKMTGVGSKEAPAQVDVQTSGSTTGERLYLRIHAKESQLRLPDLGFAPPREKQFTEIVKSHSGVVLISGPTQSGVTTTLYAILRSHDAFMQNIHTLERKPLFELDNITQKVHDGNKNDVSFARQLQSVLRREPDVVMVGDCLDRETAQIAARFGNEGRKIYMGIAAKNAFEAVARYVAFAEDAKVAAKGLAAVTCQRLVRKLCPTCRQAYKPDPQLLKKANLPVDKIEHFFRPPTQPEYDKKGNEIICPTCQGTGYVGRVGIFELMAVDDQIRQLIAMGAETNQIKTQCRKNRMYYLQEEGLLKVIEGVTSMNEVLRCLQEDTQ